MHTFDDLVRHYRRQVVLPWRRDAPAAARIWILWYAPGLQLRVSGHLSVFEHETRQAGKEWSVLDLTDAFGSWVGSHEFRHGLSEAPEELRGQLSDFEHALAGKVRAALQDAGDGAVLALSGCGAVFGLVSLANLLDRVAPHIAGRLLVTFPGSYAQGIYRLLDARSGWNYHAVPLPSDPS